MLAIAGFVLVLALIVALVKFKLMPITVFSTLPIITALIIGVSFPDTMRMVAYGMIDVLPTAALFVGSITYFGIMGDVGLFDPPVNWLTKRIKSSAVSVLIIAACIALISHLDGSGATTILITVPVMVPIARAMKMRMLPLSFIVTMMIGVMNFLPWGGPLGRAATVIGSDTVTLWYQILPVQIFGLVLVFASCFLIARIETKKGYFTASEVAVGGPQLSEADQELRRPKLFIVNLLLTITVLALLFLGVPAFIPFLIGIGIALPVNYWKGGERAQTARIKAHAKNVLPMIITIIGAGMLLGVLNDSGIIEAMADVIVRGLPPALGSVLHVIMGILSMPLTIVFDADTLNYGILPVVIEVGNNFGVTATQSALAMAVGHNMAVGLCMTSATVYFGLGMYGLEYGEAFKYSFLKVLAFGTLLILFGWAVGVL